MVISCECADGYFWRLELTFLLSNAVLLKLIFWEFSYALIWSTPAISIQLLCLFFRHGFNKKEILSAVSLDAPHKILESTARIPKRSWADDNYFAVPSNVIVFKTEAARGPQLLRFWVQFLNGFSAEAVGIVVNLEELDRTWDFTGVDCLFCWLARQSKALVSLNAVHGLLTFFEGSGLGNI